MDSWISRINHTDGGEVMPVDLSKAKSGDKVLLRDGSKIILDDRGGKTKPMVFMTDLSKWQNDGTWSPLYENCPFDIIAIIPSNE